VNRDQILDAPFHVPFLRNAGFVGREDDLATLHGLLQKVGAVGVRPAALTGMGGIGKTRLAVEYVYRYAGAYPGGVYWVNAAEPLQAELARLAIEVGLDAGGGAGSERTMRLGLAFAGYLRERPEALAVFDNVEDPLALRSPAPGFIPEALGCRLLFTTRRRDLPSTFASVEVRVLPPEAAVDLLLSSDGRRHLLAGSDVGARAEAATICRMLGHLPLAVALAAAFLDQNPEVALADYRGRLAREGVLATVDDGDVAPLDLPTRHDAAVGATLRLQWRALEGTARKNQEARLLLTAAALLGEAAVMPRARLALLTGLRDRAEDGHPARLGSALRVLHGLWLVEELTEQEIRLHPLVREFAERQIEGRGSCRSSSVSGSCSRRGGVICASRRSTSAC
jgi:NB-ARC domain